MVKLDNKTPKVMIFVGRTAEGFNKFLIENSLNTIDPETLAEYVIRGIINYENDDMASSRILLREILTLVGVEDKETTVEVTRQFGRLCDTYRSVMKTLGEIGNYGSS